jgi:hypothetical protein
MTRDPETLLVGRGRGTAIFSILLFLCLSTGCTFAGSNHTESDEKKSAVDPNDRAVALEVAAQLSAGTSTSRILELLESTTGGVPGGRPYDILVICGDWDFSVRRKDRNEHTVIMRRFPPAASAIVERTQRDLEAVTNLFSEVEGKCEHISVGIGSESLEIALDEHGQIESVLTLNQ